MTFNYCPEDGTELEATTDGLAEKAECPECGKVSREGPLDTLLFRLPPRARDVAMRGLRVLLEREVVTGDWSMLRGVLFGAITYSVLKPIAGGFGAILAAGAILFFAMEGSHRMAEEGQSGRAWNGVDIGALLIVGVLYRRGLSKAVAEAVSSLPPLSWSVVPSLWSIVTTVGELALLAVGFLISLSVVRSLSAIVHERAHYYAASLIGVDGRIEYEYERAEGRRVAIVSGEFIPEPYCWLGEDWEHAFIAAAPLVMWAPTLLVWRFGMWPTTSHPLLVGALWGGAVAWVLSSIPSGGDMGNIGYGRIKWCTEMQTTAESHRFAEGLS